MGFVRNRICGESGVPESENTKLKCLEDSAKVEGKKAVHLPLRPERPDCNNKSCPFMWRCKFNHPISRTRSQNLDNSKCNEHKIPTEESIEGSSTETKDGSSHVFHHPTCSLKSLGLPLRPGQRVCGSYWSFGLCIHGTSCKYDHSVSDGCPAHPSSTPVPPIATSSSIPRRKS